jgi:DhnA family fructose-bisphosphate aldolase class Ia
MSHVYVVKLVEECYPDKDIALRCTIYSTLNAANRAAAEIAAEIVKQYDAGTLEEHGVTYDRHGGFQVGGELYESTVWSVTVRKVRVLDVVKGQGDGSGEEKGTESEGEDAEDYIHGEVEGVPKP